MCSLAFFPRILHTDALRVHSNYKKCGKSSLLHGKIQKLIPAKALNYDLGKPKILSKERPNNVMNHFVSNNLLMEFDSGMRKQFHSKTMTTYKLNVDIKCRLLNLIKKWKIWCSEVSQQIFFKEKEPLPSSLGIPTIISKTQSDYDLNKMQQKYLLLKRTRSDTTNSHQKDLVNVFKNYLFPLKVPMHKAQTHILYPDSKTDVRLVTENSNKVRFVEMVTRRKAKDDDSKISPKIDETTKAVLKFMEDNEKRCAVYCRQYRLNFPGTLPKGMDESMSGAADAEKKRELKPNTWPPLGKPPILQPPPAQTPSLPSCPRPRPSK